ncbi:trypsin Tyr p 3.0101-like [Macrobrachium nipponense]|uniref:trypsin Tyr p 3.0101-like n=1 Tax=Macrobrachium nipponense TaxID=159736 RepID=UPI0030C7DE19
MRVFAVLLLTSIIGVDAFVKDKRCDTHDGRCVSSKAAARNCGQTLLVYICPRKKVCCHKSAWNATKKNTGRENKSRGLLSNCQCGVENVAQLPQNVPQDKLPVLQRLQPLDKYSWIVGILNQIIDNEKITCSGAIIADHYVLTAAHCLVDSATGSPATPGDIKVKRLPRHFKFPELGTPVESLVVHENYNHASRENDIGLINLRRRIVGRNVRPICLPADDRQTNVGENDVVAGWKVQNVSTISPSFSRKSTVPVLCKGSLADGTQNTVNLTCEMQAKASDEGPCFGDSGGPLTTKEGDVHTLVGVMSSGTGCGSLETPLTYTKVSQYMDWINDNTMDGKYCTGSVTPPTRDDSN